MPLTGSSDHLRRVPARSAPAPGTRDAVLSAALARRPATIPAVVAPYALQARRLDDVLTDLDAAGWARPVVHGWSARRVVAHLHALDRAVAGQVGALVPASPEDDAGRGAAPERVVHAWREQAHALVRRVGASSVALDDDIQLLGEVLPVRTALLQRAFETWIHSDDIRRALDRAPSPPPSEHLAPMADAGVRQLVAALGLVRPQHAGRVVRVDLAGPGGGRWTLPVPGARAGTAPDAALHLDVLEFCYLLGGRRDPRRVAHRSAGDPRLVADLLEVAAGFDRDETDDA
ncbi:maleylpyruvate isomerase family mycothiol-dependent enzyme [Cellulomonas sp. NPDC055163]